jgi:hypothetical protein
MTRLVLAVLLTALVGTGLLRAAEKRGATVRAILIVASKERGPADPKLAPYEGILRNNLRFESYRYVGEGTATVAPGGKAAISLPQNNRLELVSEPDGTIMVRRGGAMAAVSPGGPGAVLLVGSAGSKGEVYGIIAVAR